jgi:peptidylprolyl isomerase
MSAVRIARLCATAVISVALLACEDATAPHGSNPATETYNASLGVNIAAMTKLSDDLYVTDVTVGTGKTIASGDSVTVNYTGWLKDGTQFDTSVGKAPFAFKIGRSEVIGGWDQGLIGVKAGGTRRLVIGSFLGYGATGAGCAPFQTPQCKVPPGATLIFDVTVVSAK